MLDKVKWNKEDNVKAKIIQDFLQALKHVIKSKYGFSSIFYDENFPLRTIKQKNEFLALCLALKEIRPEIFTEKNLLNVSEKSFELGNELEIGIARIIKGLEIHFTGKEKEEYEMAQVHKVGDKKIMPTIFDEMTKEYFTTVYKEVSKELNAFKGEDKIAKSFSSVSGKIDAVGLYGELNITSSVELENFLVDALRNATFTLKNYISTDHLKFGQTNPFRVFLTVIPSDIKNPIGQYYRIKGCLEGHYNSHSSVPKLFYRIRAIYELTGAGENYTNLDKNNPMYDVLTQSFGAKYLIWNNPIKDIYVIPTGRIVKAIIENKDYINPLPNNWREIMYGPITIKQVQLEKLTN